MSSIEQKAQVRMQKVIDFFEKTLLKIRAGRATPALLDDISIDYYGTPTALAQVGNVSAPEAQLLVIAPWEKNLLSIIEKAILKADLGITPQNDGNVIRLPIPALSEERRKDLVKQVKKLAEEARVSVRNVRRDINDELKKDDSVSEDEEKQGKDKVQKMTDKFIVTIDELASKKEKELLTF